jgi:PAS domain S-box-containing protein
VAAAMQRKPQTSAPFRLAGALVIALVLLAIGLILWQLRASHDEERARVLEDTEKRASQLAGAVAERINVLVRSTDFVLQQVRRDFGSDDARFRVIADSLLSSFPERSLLQLSFANADGELTYSNLGLTGNINIRDRDHFKAHVGGGDRLFISKPLLGRVSKAWTIQFSRPVLRDGRFAGVAVLSLAPEYISKVLSVLELEAKDTIALTDIEGVFLARNRGLDTVIGRTLSPARPFMQPGAAPRGTYRVASFDGGSDRFFAWQRLPDTTLVAVVGLDGHTVLAPLEARFRQEWINAGLLSALLIALGIAVLMLLTRLAHGQSELAASEARFRSLTGLSADWYWEQDANFRFVKIEGALRDRSGFTDAEHIGKARWELPALNMSAADWASHKAQLDAHLPFHDLELRRAADRGGRAHWISSSGEPIFDERGTFRGYRGIGRDISERKLAEQEREQLEAQLRQAQKMEALGTLAGGIAHDFNNLLAAIFGNLDRAREDAGADSPAQLSLAEIASAAQRARDLVRQILTFSRREPLERRVVDLREIVQDAVKLLRASLPKGIELVATLPTALPNVLADPTQLHQVLMNLGANAAQAMAERRGRIEISLAGVVIDGDATGIELTPGRYVRLSVTDDGPGMDAATRGRIFDPFFTTKAVGEGTGLGLAVVDGIVKGHGGSIEVESETGQGSAFHLYFPAAAAESVACAEQLPPAPQSGNGQRILLLDDEEALVLIAQAMLERLGYRAHAYTVAAQALAAFNADPAGFDLLVTDLNMPGASGLEVARAMRQLRHDLPVVLVSGFVTDELHAQARALGIREVTYKPHTVADLAAAVQHALAVPG